MLTRSLATFRENQCLQSGDRSNLGVMLEVGRPWGVPSGEVGGKTFRWNLAQVWSALRNSVSTGYHVDTRIGTSETV